MKPGENQSETQLENEPAGKLKRGAINQLAIGSLIILWGSLLALKQVGIIQNNVSTWPFPLTALGVLLVASGIYRLSRARRL